MEKIIIVESPSKSNTIESYMGKDYKVLSSKGHIRDLSIKGRGGLGVDIEAGFVPDYQPILGKEALIKQLIKECKGKEVYLATDPDREGEAISYHLACVLGIDIDHSKRIVFNEITKTAVSDAFNNVRNIDMDLVRSQETRRILDRILGFKLSKLLQSRIKSKSAGRVQSVALKLIVDLEKEILAFISTPYYELEAKFDHFTLDFIGFDNKKIDVLSLSEAQKIKDSLDEHFKLDQIEKKEIKRESKQPYTTSTLQQDGSNKLNYNSTKTMRIAQTLYEGKNIGNESMGLITYMRTDSTRMSDAFVTETKNYILDNIGKNYLGRIKTTKQANIQDAHEAIRPTSIHRTPESIKQYLTAEEYKIYNLIYQRTLASLMAPAIFENTKAIFTNNQTYWKITGQRMLFDGYLKVYGITEEDKNKEIPEFVEALYKYNEIIITEKFTQPKSRYTEASLIKDMEELGIGRPSTYAQTMYTLKERAYIEVKDKKLIPTQQGILTTDKLDEYFSSIINVKYTANMENVLDSISRGDASNIESLTKFYEEFMPLYNAAFENMDKIQPVMTEELCPLCGKNLVIRKGQYGEFLACSGFPECKYIKQEEQDIAEGIPCPKCNKGHIIKKQALRGKNKGQSFYACSNYPECKTIYNHEPTSNICKECGNLMVLKDNELICGNINCGQETINEVLCPKCKKGHFVLRIALKGKNKGNKFYACSNFPRCKNIILEEPHANCTKCGDVLIKDNDEMKCMNPNCN